MVTEQKVWILLKFGFLCKSKSLDLFRRTKATHMLLNGISLPVIQRFLGHESITTTEQYLELGSREMTEAAEHMEQILSGNDHTDCGAIWKQKDVLSRLKELIR